MTTGMTTETDLVQLRERLSALRTEIGRVIVGQEQAIEELLLTFLAGGHCLLEGVPGLAKTLMIRTLAEAVDLSFRRIQFTPDLMPTDIIGTEILEEEHATGQAFLQVRQGSGVREHRAGRRDQPHPAQDPGGAARGDAGVRRHLRRHDLPARAALLRPGDPEPDRADRHLSAARSTARSFPALYPDRLPGGRRGARDPAPHHRARRRRRCAAGPFGSGSARGPGGDAGGRISDDPARLCHPIGPVHPPRAAPQSAYVQASGSAGAPGRAPGRPSSSPPRPGPSCTAGSRSRPTICAPLPRPCCGIACW